MCTMKFKFDLNHPYVPTEEGTLNMLGASEVFEITKVDSDFSEVTVPIVSFSQAHEATATQSILLEQQSSNVSKCMTKLSSSKKSNHYFPHPRVSSNNNKLLFSSLSKCKLVFIITTI